MGSSSRPSTDETLAGDATQPTRAESPRPQRRGDEVGRYLLIDPLGRGAMGQVFRAYDPDLDRQVALKLLLPHGDRDPTQMLDEAKAMARIDHPNVVTVYDVGIHQGVVFIAMEIVDGPTLDRWLSASRTPAEILDVLIEAGRGLAAAHAAGVVHRDFKPANVLVTEDGRPKVGDFGLAGLEGHGDPEDSGGTMGTPGYMSPEHVVGSGIDPRSDQFSFAIALYEALHGERPFSAETWPALASQIVSGEVRPELARRRSGVDGILRRALAVEPEQRFASMDELIDALERTRRRRWPWFLGGGALVVLLGLAVFDSDEITARCEPGVDRIATWWNDGARSALRVQRADYTEAFALAAKARFVATLDDYAERWAQAHDESCAAVGPRAQGGTPAQRATAQCLDNRLDSLRGLVELATTAPLDAGRAHPLAKTLPALDDCTSGRWIPYPAEPERAARAAELVRELERIKRDRLAERSDHVSRDSAAAVREARALGVPFLLARALSQHARATDASREAEALYDEAIAVAVANGHDLLAAEIINDLLLSMGRWQTDRWREIAHLTAVGRGLIERGGGDEAMLGHLATNESNVLRRVARYDEALSLARRAEEHYARAESQDGVAAARINQAIVMIGLGQLDEAIPRMQAALEDFERINGMSSPRAFQGHRALLSALIYAARSEEAFEIATDLHRRMSKTYSTRAYTRRAIDTLYAYAAINRGEVEVVEMLLGTLRDAPDTSVRERVAVRFIEIGMLQAANRHEEVLALADPELLPEGALDRDRVTLRLTTGYSRLLLGDRATVHTEVAALAAQGVATAKDSSKDQLALLVYLAVLSDAPPPPDASWRAFLPDTDERGPAKLDQWQWAVVEAITGPGDPVPEVRRIREELIAAYHRHEPMVQAIDAWLDVHAEGAPSTGG